MKPLVNSYNSSGSWILKNQGSIYELVSNYKAILYGYIFTSIALLIGGILFYGFNSSEKAIYGLIIGIVTCFISLLIGVSNSLEQKKQKSIFIYDSATNRAIFSKLGLTIENAAQAITFSYEIHCGTSNYPNSELNIIIDKKRQNFLSSRGENLSIEKFIKQLENIGFSVLKYRHPNV